MRKAVLLGAFVAVAAEVRILFWSLTGRTWEDALITAAHARNAVTGLGLTHHPGEGPVHGFTSALSVLIPLLGSLIDPEAGIAFMKAVSLVAGCVTIYLAFAIAERLEAGTWPTVFLLSYLALDFNQVFYGMSGMETQVAVAIVLALVLFALERRYVPVGLMAGLALMARPDFLLLVVPMGLIFAAGDLRGTARAAAVAAVVVAPWIIFTSLYYGSPVPDTIVAKSLRFTYTPADAGSLANMMSLLWRRVAENVPYYLNYFTPFLGHDTMRLSVPDALLYPFGIAFVALGVAGAVVYRGEKALLGLAAFVIVFSAYRAVMLPRNYYTWYLPPVMAAHALLAALGLAAVMRRAPRAGAAIALALAIAFAAHIPFSFPLEARVQRIEDAVRTPAGEYLARVVRPGEAVVSESAGYLGYYSRVMLHDYPGLTSPKARLALASMPFASRSLGSLVAALMPEWLVLRPIEVRDLWRLHPSVAARYGIDHYFAAEADLRYGLATATNGDREFFVLRRKD